MTIFCQETVFARRRGSGSVCLSSRASLLCEARDLGVPIRAGARKARLQMQTDPLPQTASA